MSHEGLIHSLWRCMVTQQKGPLDIPKCSAWKRYIFVAHTIMAMGQQAGHLYPLKRPSALQSSSASSWVCMHIHRCYYLGLSAIAMPFARSTNKFNCLVKSLET